jgi:TctA family transporter
VVGYVLEYSLAPPVLALVLGDRADAFRQSMISSSGSLWEPFRNPASRQTESLNRSA